MAADIINKQDPTGKAMNPGLVALWEDERLRREAAGVRDSLSPPPSPPTPATWLMKAAVSSLCTGRLGPAAPAAVGRMTAAAGCGLVYTRIVDCGPALLAGDRM